MNTCLSRSPLARTGALAVVFGMLMVPVATSSYAAEDVPSTVRAVIGGDGSVSSISREGDGDEPTADSLPVTLGISQSPDGDRTTTNYEVTNTTVTSEAVEYLGADGQPATSQQDVALPLVAQLAVRLPASRTDVAAPGARITTLSDGSYELVWSLVLFSPIGAPVADVSFTAGGTGEPLARLDVSAVQPSGVQGLSTTAQSANATVNGNGILSTVANGANAGLLALADGVGQLLEGLDKLEAGAIQLNEGIAAGADGAAQLATGSKAAKKGSGDLAAGLAQISSGLNQLSAAQGLPAALDGAKKLQVGVDALRAGMGATDKPESVLGGLAAVGGGLGQVKGGLDGLAAGLPQARGGVDQVRTGLQGAGAPLDQLTALLTAIRAGIPGCAPGAPVAQPTNGCQAVNTAAFIVSHPAGTLGATDAGGLKQGLAAAAGGLGQVSDGLAAAVGGVALLQVGTGQLQAGVTKLQGGAAQIAGGLESGSAAKPGVAEGLDALVSGLTAAVGGVGQLADGAGKAAVGSKALDTGIGKIADGQQRVADGLPAAVDGSGQIADGLGAAADGGAKVEKGLGDVRTQAVAVLSSQFSQGTSLARQQLAGLDASTALIASTPGAATTTWVLTQSEGDIVAELASGESSTNDTARTAGLIAGGALLLMGGLAGGFVSGRRSSASV